MSVIVVQVGYDIVEYLMMHGIDFRVETPQITDDITSDNLTIAQAVLPFRFA
ncbi:MAG: hypothetical protein HGA38_04180 [Candidatus Moranbacteria bacterium]|nr:hypothetical protein [Candidatus Moranbacteria bacterium]